MPILAEEPCMFPEHLLEPVAGSAGVSDEAAQRAWWVIYTKARQEKALGRELLAHQVPFYLPLIPKEHLIRGRRVRSFVPLFDGYVFLFGSSDERLVALTTNHISRILPVPRQEELRRDLLQVRHVIASGLPLTVESRLSPGHRVRIRTGPLGGLEGTIIRREGTNRLLIAVEFMAKGVSVETYDFTVEPGSVPAVRQPNSRPAETSSDRASAFA